MTLYTFLQALLEKKSVTMGTKVLFFSKMEKHKKDGLMAASHDKKQ